MYELLESRDMTAGGSQIQCVSPQMVPPRQLGRGLQQNCNDIKFGNFLRAIVNKTVRRWGQLILKGLFGVIIWTKNSTFYF